eukprot:SM004890S16938  [mRNA]  locus=s4890:172:1066:+ [translate_table: standard]
MLTVWWGPAKEERLKAKAGVKAVKEAGGAEAEDDVNNVAAWVAKSRALDEQRRAEEKAKAERMARMLAEQDEEVEHDDDEEPGSLYSTKDLAGLKVRHGLDKVMEGGAVVLTLKDSTILDSGELND